jgi:hypothetical protein
MGVLSVDQATGFTPLPAVAYVRMCTLGDGTASSAAF